jgi:phenylacetate-CoA ligase
MVDDAEALLSGAWSDVVHHINDRLQITHGPSSSIAWLEKQPITSKGDVSERIRRLDRSELSGLKVDWRRTSGSTGEPFVFVKDREMTGWMDATMWAAYRWHGVEPGQPHVRFWGVPFGVRKRAGVFVKDALLNRRRMSAFRIDEASVRSRFNSLVRLRPVYAYGYPSLLKLFADQCMRAGLDGRKLGLEVVITTGELLVPQVRIALGEYFGCRIVNEYGCSESGVIAIDCELGFLHSVPIAAFPEIVSQEGLAVPDGVAGEVAITDLYGRAAPLLRYRLRDHATRASVQCGCGRELPILTVDSGRVDSFIQTPERGLVYDAILAYTVPASVQRFRAKQLAVDELEVELVPGIGFDESRTPADCIAVWEKALGPGMRVTTRTVNQIAPEPSGKLRYFIPLS